MPRKSSGRLKSSRNSNFPNQVHIWAKEARNMRTDKMSTIITSVKLKLSFNSIPVEIDLSGEDGPLETGHIKDAITELLSTGFSAPVSWNKTGDDVLGKYGVVTKIEPADKMFAITCKLDGVDKEFVFKAFTATEFRKGDYVKVVKNDRGYKTGQLVTPEEYGGQKELAGGDKGKDDIPF